MADFLRLLEFARPYRSRLYLALVAMSVYAASQAGFNYIVKEIIELHGGQVEIASTSGAGTTVTLWIQRREAPSPVAADAPAAGAEAARS